MNEKTGTGVSSEKENVKESQSQSRSVTPSPDTPSGARLGASHVLSLSPVVLSSLSLPFAGCYYNYSDRHSLSYHFIIYIYSGRHVLSNHFKIDHYIFFS